ncbi:ABC transporter permease [Rubrobacter naiadicus]|uniref:ABC transporter permease n=1 Tax=Rubrobacter naiadicus TaxID=1392641 RepID=UPI00235FC273|nr:ABC transporter permease [Rubrobacter naiadicus]
MSAERAVPSPGVARVRVPERGLRQDVRAVRIVWQRELIRFYRDRLRMFTSLLQPVLFLFVLGTGLSTLASGGIGGLSLRTFMFPGVLSMATLFTAMLSAGSIVWDREFGFLREMLVAPVRRSTIVIGKCLGGATVATSQGVIILCLAGLVGVPYSPALIATLLAEILLLSFTITASGVMAAARIQNMQSFFALVQMFMMPMFFLSGALYPLSNLPDWLQVLTRINPLTYAVDPMRRAVFDHLDVNAATRHALVTGVTWWGWQVPVWLELAIVAFIGVVMLAISIAEFRRTG